MLNLGLRGIAVVVGVAGLFVGAWRQAQIGSPSHGRLELEFHEGTDMEAVPSPDGRYLALQLWQQSWVLDMSSGEARLLTDVLSPPDEHGFPRWSPDGASIVFASLRSDGGRFVVPASGGERHQLTRREFDLWPSWSPDGKRIVFWNALAVR